MYRKFLFSGFLKSFSRSFSFPNWDNPNPCSFYTWNDRVYHSFMMSIMRSLEPRQEEAGEVLFKELEAVDEVLFFTKGTYEIGYEFNGEDHFKIRYKNSNLIGAYNVTFNQKS